MEMFICSNLETDKIVENLCLTQPNFKEDWIVCWSNEIEEERYKVLQLQVDLNARIDATHNFFQDEEFNFGIDMAFQSDFFCWKNVSINDFQYRYSLPTQFDYFLDQTIHEKLIVTKSLDIEVIYREMDACEPSANSFWVLPKVAALINDLVNIWFYKLDNQESEQITFSFFDLLTFVWDSCRA